MKFLKGNDVFETDKHNGCNLSQMTSDEKIMILSLVVPKGFNGTYCANCPLYSGSMSCNITEVCPLTLKED